MRKGVILALAAIALAGCAASIPIPRPGQLLYVTTFDAYNDDWQLYEGELAAQIVSQDGNAALQIAVDAAQAGAFTILDQIFSDFDLVVQARQVAGPEDIEAPGFGVLFRHQDNNNFYAFMISGDGYYQVIRRRDGVDEELSDWAPSAAILRGQAINRIRVIGQGETFTFFVNDVQMPLCLTVWNPLVPGECQVPATETGGQATWSAEAVVNQLVDSSFPQGRIGVGARSFAEPGIRVYFDNLLVCGPYETAAVPFRCEELPDGT